MIDNVALQKDVQEAIKREPRLTTAEIAVTAKDGIVTLTGIVDNYMKKTQAEHAAKNVPGVKAVVEKIVVKFNEMNGKRDDSEIAAEVVHALKSNWQFPNDKVRAKVENGWIVLDGELEHHYQREAAKNAVKNLTGVIGLTNNITVKPIARDPTEKNGIGADF